MRQFQGNYTEWPRMRAWRAQAASVLRFFDSHFAGTGAASVRGGSELRISVSEGQRVQDFHQGHEDGKEGAAGNRGSGGSLASVETEDLCLAGKSNSGI